MIPQSQAKQLPPMKQQYYTHEVGSLLGRISSLSRSETIFDGCLSEERSHNPSTISTRLLDSDMDHLRCLLDIPTDIDRVATISGVTGRHSMTV